MAPAQRLEGLVSEAAVGHRPVQQMQDLAKCVWDGEASPAGVDRTKYDESASKGRALERRVLFSDGIIERENEMEEQYGADRLKQLVRKHRDKPAKEINDLIFKDVFKFGHKAVWEDDATVVVVKRLE